MATRNRAPKIVAPTLTKKETCTTENCTAPRIRLNALKCTEHEIVYRAAAKARAAARKAAASTEAAPAAVAAETPAPKRATRVRAMGSGPVARA